MPNAPRPDSAQNSAVSLALFTAFAVLVVAGLALLGPVSPARADDRSDAVLACRTAISQHADGMDPSGLALDRIGGGGRRFKVWLKTGTDNADGPRQFYCLVKRNGTVEEATALNADGTPGQSLIAAR